MIKNIFRAVDAAIFASLFIPLVAGATLSIPNFPAVGNIDTVVEGTTIDPRGLAVCNNNTKLYIADGLNNRVMVTDMRSGDTMLVAGTGVRGYGGDGGPATAAQFNFPTDVVCDSSGNVYIADTSNNRVRKVDTRGVITTVVGIGVAGSGGDGGQATQAYLWSPRGLALDAQGNLYIAELDNNRVRKVTPNGIITTFAGNGTWGNNGDNGVATSITLSNPSSVAVDAFGNVFIADNNMNKIRRVTPDGVISTIAGNPYEGFAGDGGPASAAKFKHPYQIKFDALGNLIILDNGYGGNSRVRRIAAVGGYVTSQSIITTIAGTGATGSTGDGGPATSAALFNPSSIAIDNANNIYVAVTENTIPSLNNRVRKFTAGGNISTFVGGDNGDGRKATYALVNPQGMAATSVSGADILYMADGANNRVRRVDLSSGIIETVAGTGTAGFQDGVAGNAKLWVPAGVAVDRAGNLFITDVNNNRIRKVTAGSNGLADSGDTITTVVGSSSGVAGSSYAYGGDGGQAMNAYLAHPSGLGFDSAGNLYIADSANNAIREVLAGNNGLIDPTDVITTVVGGQYGPPADVVPIASATRLGTPGDVAVSPTDGMLYIADSGNHSIRRVNLTDRTLELVAGQGSRPGNAGNDVPAWGSFLSSPMRITFDRAGNLYIADMMNYKVRKVEAVGGRIIPGSRGSIMTVVAGTGVLGTSNDGGSATSANINIYLGTGLAVDSNNHLFISQSVSAKIRVVTLSDVAAPPPPTAPTCTLTANPTTVQVGSPSTLSWTTTNATAFSIDQGVGAVTPAASGSRDVSPSAATIYTGTATGTGGSAQCTATVMANGVGTVAGKVNYYTSSSIAVPGVSVQLSGAGGQLSAQTDASGNFTFSNVPTGDWSVTYSKAASASDPSAISAIDASTELQGTTGLTSLTGLQLKACDANGSGGLTAIDASYILQFGAGLIQSLPASNNGANNWGFDTSTNSFSLAADGTHSEQVNAYRLGDCNGSWRP